MALICNNVYKSLWAWWEEAFLNGCSPWVHPRHCLIDAGPPGPPDKVSVEEITDSTAQLSWTPGRDNGSPITGYIIQARTPFTVGWLAVDTGTLKRGFCSIYFAWIFICSSFSWSPVVYRSIIFLLKNWISTLQCQRWSMVTCWQPRWWVWMRGWSTSSGWWHAML